MTRLGKTLELLDLERTSITALTQFVELFARWNDKINLSAARTRDQIEEHVEDSLHVIPSLRDAAALSVIDVGSGGGFPVVPAAIVLPGVRFVSLEPIHKKHAFLRTAARELGLANLECRAERVEDHPARDYDLAMSRATFDLNEWFEHGLRLVRVGGRVLGLEAIRRDDLPSSIERREYQLAGKTRAIVSLTRAA